MAGLDWGLLNTNPGVAQQQGFDYAQKIQAAAANRQAGQLYANGDTAGASRVLAQSGNIPAAQQTQEYGRKTQQESQKQYADGQDYLAQSVQVFQKIAEAHAGDPDKGAAALGQAFDQIAPEAKARTGIGDQQLAQFRQSLVADPQGTLARIQQQLPAKYQTVGHNIVKVQGGQITPVYEGQKDAPAGYTNGADGKSLQFIPGGPADPKTVGNLASERRMVIVNNPVPSQQGGGSGSELSPDGLNLQVDTYIASRGAITPQFGYGKGGNEHRDKFYNTLSQRMNEQGITPSDIASGKAEYKANASALGQVSKQRNSVESYEKTVLDNMKIVEANLAKGAPKGSVPLFNRWVQAGRDKLQGDPDVTAYNTAIQTVANEYAKVMSGGTGSSAASSDSARAEAHSLINNAQTPAQITAAMRTMRQEMANRIESLKSQEGDLKNRLGNHEAPAASAPASSSDGKTDALLSKYGIK